MATYPNYYTPISPYGIQPVNAYPYSMPPNNNVFYSPYSATVNMYSQQPMYYTPYQQPMSLGNTNAYQQNVILFYDDDKPYYELTNFARIGFNLDGVYWPTSEHYFQAQKFEGYPYKKEEVRKLASPRDAFDFVRKPENRSLIRKDWQSQKEEIMYIALKAKFTQNRDILIKLLNTNECVLIEDSPHDMYWGIGADKKGKNRLGELLMKLRTELRHNSIPTPSAPIYPSTTDDILNPIRPNIPMKRSSSLNHLNTYLSSDIMDDEVVYDVNDSSNFLSNSFHSPFNMNGKTWPTVLHYFVARKFDMKKHHITNILSMNDAKDVHLYSRNWNYKFDIVKYWDLEKKRIMKETLKAKFEQNIILRQKLLDTEGKYIIERSVHDVYWSQLADGTGQNIMGQLLCEVRTELKTHSFIPPKQYSQSSSSIHGLDSLKSLIPSKIHSYISNNSDNLSYNIPRSSIHGQINTNNIHFSNEHTSEYFEFSTYSHHGFTLDGKHWRSIQHYYQAQKFATDESKWIMDEIRKAKTSELAFSLGTRKSSNKLVKNWDSKREAVMLKALKAKFNQDRRLREKLKNTIGKDIIHDCESDFWGVGKSGLGENKLGKLLMQIREELFTNPKSTSHKSTSTNSANSTPINDIAKRKELYSISYDHNGKIEFSDENSPYFEFSPFSPHPIIIDSVRWKSLNHYFQAKTISDRKTIKEIMTATSKRATYLAQKQQSRCTQNEKENIMKRGLEAKFTQHLHLQQLLIDSGSKELVFADPDDKLWGSKGLRQNKYGEMLMQLRNQLQSPKSTTNYSNSNTDGFLSDDDHTGLHKRITELNVSKQILPAPSKVISQRILLLPILLFLFLLLISIYTLRLMIIQ